MKLRDQLHKKMQAELASLQDEREAVTTRKSLGISEAQLTAQLVKWQPEMLPDDILTAPDALENDVPTTSKSEGALSLRDRGGAVKSLSSSGRARAFSADHGLRPTVQQTSRSRSMERMRPPLNPDAYEAERLKTELATLKDELARRSSALSSRSFGEGDIS